MNAGILLKIPKPGNCLRWVKLSLPVRKYRLYSTEYTSGPKTTEEPVGQKTEKDDVIKERILKASLVYVNKYGWNRKSLCAGAEAEGFPTTIHGLFPRGGTDLIFYYQESCNRQLADELSCKSQENKKVHIFIREALETRLKMIIPYMDNWPQAMGIMSSPQNAKETFNCLSTMLDDIWFYAGDKSVDMSWYTKRASLGVVYFSTELFMVQDSSVDYENTWEFLQRRLDDVAFMGKSTRKLQQTFELLTSSAKGMFIVGQNVLGLHRTR